MPEPIIPWRENATAVVRPRGRNQPILTIECEGPLLAVVQTLMKRPRRDLPLTRVSLPDRGAPPFAFEGKALIELLRAAPKLAQEGPGFIKLTTTPR